MTAGVAPAASTHRQTELFNIEDLEDEFDVEDTLSVDSYLFCYIWVVHS